MNYPGQKSGVMTVFGLVIFQHGYAVSYPGQVQHNHYSWITKKKKLGRMFGKMFAHNEGKMGERGGTGHSLCRFGF